jgi:hypothetical protein
MVVIDFLTANLYTYASEDFFRIERTSLHEAKSNIPIPLFIGNRSFNGEYLIGGKPLDY